MLRLDGVHTFHWKYDFLFSWKSFDIFDQMACFTGHNHSWICEDVWWWYVFITVQTLINEIFETWWRKFRLWQNFLQSTCTVEPANLSWFNAISHGFNHKNSLVIRRVPFDYQLLSTGRKTVCYVQASFVIQYYYQIRCEFDRLVYGVN